MSLRQGLTWLMGGAGLGGALGLAGLLLAAHVLPAPEFAALAVAQGLGATLRLVTVQPWQALVRYLPGSQAPGTLVGAAWAVDQVCALAAGLALAVVLVAMPGLVGLSAGLALATLPLALGLAVQACDPWTGLLLHAGRHDLVARVQVGAGVIRLAGLAVAAFIDAGLFGMVLGHVVGDLAWALGMVWASWPLRPTGIAIPVNLQAWRKLEVQHPGLGRLALTTTGTSLVSGAGAQADVPLVAAVGGPAVAGAWRLARGLANLLLILAPPLRQGLLAHASAGRSLPAGIWTGVMAGSGVVVGGVVAGFGDPLLRWAVGAQGVDLALPLGIALGGAALHLAGLPWTARLVAAGRERRVLAAAAVAVPTYLLALVMTGDRLVHVAWAFAGHQALALVILAIAGSRNPVGPVPRD